MPAMFFLRLTRDVGALFHIACALRSSVDWRLESNKALLGMQWPGRDMPLPKTFFPLGLVFVFVNTFVFVFVFAGPVVCIVD